MHLPRPRSPSTRVEAEPLIGINDSGTADLSNTDLRRPAERLHTRARLGLECCARRTKNSFSRVALIRLPEKKKGLSCHSVPSYGSRASARGTRLPTWALSPKHTFYKCFTGMT